MIVNLSETGEDLSADVCIVGAGAAGITLARKLAAHSLSVILCEGGGMDYSEASQATYQGEVEGDPYYDIGSARLRYFGGTTNHWTGWCRPLDPYDFAAKNGKAETAWPISAQTLAPYLDETRAILELEAGEDGPELASSGLKRIEMEFSPPVRFADKYREELEASEAIRVVLNANLTGARAADGRAESLRVGDYEGNERSISAKYFVVACGGIENARLLLWLHESGQLPLGRSGDVAGRYWAEHPHAPIGDVVIREEDAFRFKKFALDFFAPTPAFMESRGTLNCQLFLKSTNYGGAKEVIADLLCTAPTLGKWAMDQLGKKLACVGELNAAWEQEPVAGNRVSLDSERDRFGIPRPVLHWTRNAQDFRTVRETAAAFAKHCAETDIARVRLPDWLLSGAGEFPEIGYIAGYHHMGGTRMAHSPASGVVDGNCRLFGAENVYVAGSSVFPSVGHANPTFTIIQLALRLADHLKALRPRHS